MNTELSDVLDRVLSYFDRFVWFQSDHQLYATTMWTAVTYLVDYVDTVPMLWLTSPTRECGKSLVLDVVEQLAHRPMASVDMSNAVLFRLAAEGHTLLIDECDNIFGRAGDEEKRALINAAYRRGRAALRMGGPPRSMVVESYDVFCPIALAGIGQLPDTVASRCVPIRLQRKPRSINKQRWRLRAVKASGEAEQLRHDLEAALAPLADEIGAAWPHLPDQLGDRAQEIWEPMLAVADTAQNGWERWARDAAVALHTGTEEADGSIDVQLLSDIRDVFGDDDKLATATLLERLHDLEEAPWGEWFGKPITARFLAKHLKEFQVRSKTLRIGGATAKGYERAAFIDPWDRYLSVTSVAEVTTVAGQAVSAESADVTIRHTAVTPVGVTAALPIVTDSEDGESSGATSEVTPVTSVTSEEGILNLTGALDGEVVADWTRQS